MAKFSLANAKDVKRLKDELNSLLEGRIRNLDLDSTLSTLHEQPFGAIKNVFESVTDKLFETKEGKAIISRWVKAVRNNKPISEAYSVNEFVHNSPHVSDVNMLLSEAISMADGFNENEFNEGKKKISEVVKEAVKAANVDSDWVNENINREYSVNESVDYLMTNAKKHSNLAEYVNRFHSVKSYLEEHMQEEKGNDVEKSVPELVEELNVVMEGLEEWQKTALKDIAIARLSKSDFSHLFESYKKSCCDAINEKLENENSVETKSHLEAIGNRLREKQFSKDSIYEDIMTLAELRSTLEE